MPHAAPTPAIQKKVIIAACFGTFLEWYDFLTFASLASYFGVLFFPPDDPTTSLLASLATFGVGMIVRPLGAALFGSLGDRYGRRTIFIATIVLMGLATVGVGVLPKHRRERRIATQQPIEPGIHHPEFAHRNSSRNPSSQNSRACSMASSRYGCAAWCAVP